MVDESSPATIAQFFARTVATRGGERALGYIRSSELHWLSWQEVANLVHQLAATLRAAGIEPGDRVAQVSENRFEWIIVDLALHVSGAVHVPIHVTLSGEQMAAQIADSGTRLVFVSTDELLAKVESLVDPSIVILRHEEASRELSRVSPQPPAPSPFPGDLATILYTSGTTGRPRGVMLSQQNLASNAAALTAAFCADADQTRLGILPLSHIYARTCDLYTWVHQGSRLVVGESRETLQRDLQLVRPTAFNAVPYVYQRIADRIRSAGWDVKADEKCLHDYFGGRIEMLCCGGAPLAPDIEQWFAARNLPILPGYGLTEASPVITVSTPDACRPGAVGRAVPGVELRIAEDGEIVTRGPHVMLGYWQDEAATAALIRDSWLHTGDLGHIDADGMLTIRGRKKELIVLCTGKKVHPARVESLLTASPMIEQAAVFGDGQPHLVALIVPTTAASPPSHEAIGQEIERCLYSAANEEKIRHFTLLERAFSIDRGELTAKLSLCRKVIAGNFDREISCLCGRMSATGKG